MHDAPRIALADVAVSQTPEENELETGVRSKEARKYIFKSLDEIGTVSNSRRLQAAYQDRCMFE